MGCLTHKITIELSADFEKHFKNWGVFTKSIQTPTPPKNNKVEVTLEVDNTNLKNLIKNLR